MTLSQRSSVISASVLRSISDPALLTRTSSRPKRSSISPTIRPTSDACNLTPYPASRLRTAIMLGRSISLEIAASAPAFEAASSTSSPALPDGEGKELIAEIRQRQPERPVAVGERQVEQHQVERILIRVLPSSSLRARTTSVPSTCPRTSSRACANAEWSSTISTRSIATPPRHPLAGIPYDHNPSGERVERTSYK